MIAMILMEWFLAFGMWPTTTIRIVDYMDNRHAMCFKPYGGYTYIRVNETHWNSIPYVHKRELLFHELGHCEFNLRHPNDVTIPAIMRPYVYSTELDGSNWKQLLEDMKHATLPFPR